MNISEAIFKRRSIRAYTDKPVSADELEQIIEAGRWAPNAGPFQISVVRNHELLKKINDRTYNIMINSSNDFLKERASLPGYQPLYGAPVVLLLSGPDNTRFPVHNTVLAAENMVLMATGLGLGTCLIFSITAALNGPQNLDLARAAGIPSGYSLQCAIAIGNAADKNKFSMNDRTRKGSVNYVD